MPDPPNILASSDGSMIKPIIFGLVVIFWVISAIVSAINKSLKKSNAPRPIASSRAIPRAIPTAPLARPSPARQVARPPPLLPAGRVQRAPTPARGLTSAPQQAALAPAIAAPPSGRARHATVTAPVIARWLTPAVMRRQYILTEVFDPPPALREAEDVL